MKSYKYRMEITGLPDEISSSTSIESEDPQTRLVTDSTLQWGRTISGEEYYNMWMQESRLQQEPFTVHILDEDGNVKEMFCVSPHNEKESLNNEQ